MFHPDVLAIRLERVIRRPVTEGDSVYEETLPRRRPDRRFRRTSYG